MKTLKNVKLMLLGIGMLVLAIWCLLFGSLDAAAFFSAIGCFLPLPAIILIILGFFFVDVKEEE